MRWEDFEACLEGLSERELRGGRYWSPIVEGFVWCCDGVEIG